MTPQQTNQPQQPRLQHHEDRKLQKLAERIEAKLDVQAKTIRETNQASSKN
ncbi:MAG: hypothetical protein ACRD3H_04405 [Terriglobales bacterium]